MGGALVAARVPARDEPEAPGSYYIPDAIAYGSFACSVVSLVAYLICYILVARRKLPASKGTADNAIIHGYYLTSIISQTFFARTSLLWLPLYLENFLRLDSGMSGFYSALTDGLHALFNRIVPAECILLIVMGSFDSLRGRLRFQKATWIACAVYTIVSYAVLVIPAFYVCMTGVQSSQIATADSLPIKIVMGLQEILVIVPYIASIWALAALYKNSAVLFRLETAYASQHEPLVQSEQERGGRKRLNAILITRCVPTGLMLIWNVVWIVLTAKFDIQPPGFPTEMMWLANAVLMMLCEICNAMAFIIG